MRPRSTSKPILGFTRLSQTQVDSIAKLLSWCWLRRLLRSSPLARRRSNSLSDQWTAHIIAADLPNEPDDCLAEGRGAFLKPSKALDHEPRRILWRWSLRLCSLDIRRSHARRLSRGRLLLLQDPFVVRRHDLHELALHRFPAVQHVLRDRAAGDLGVLGDQLLDLGDVFFGRRGPRAPPCRGCSPCGTRPGPAPTRRRRRPTCRPRSCGPSGRGSRPGRRSCTHSRGRPRPR